MDYNFIITLVKIALAITGAYFLYDEVRISHTVERFRYFLDYKWPLVEELRELYINNPREFLKKNIKIGFQESEADFPKGFIEERVKYIDSLSDEKIEEEVKKNTPSGLHQYYMNFEEINKHYHNVSSEGAIRRREIRLRLGIIFIFISALIEIVLTILSKLNA